MKALQKFYNNKKVLVTGGAGFIGSHLVEKLVELGARVTVLENPYSCSINNLKSVIHAINILYADVRSDYSCLKATTNQDIVFHIAALVSVAESMKNPDLCYAINTQGTKNILEGCRQNSVGMVVFSSSSAVYGNKTDPCVENDHLNPQSPYAISKMQGEALCKEYSDRYGMNTAILRYFNVYGQRQNPNGPYAAVVARFTQLLKEGMPLPVFGDGLQTRDFIHVSKVVEANLIMGMQTTMKGDIFNIGTGSSITLLELIEQLKKELNINAAEIHYLPAREGDIKHSHANCSKYLTFYGNTPTI